VKQRVTRLIPAVVVLAIFATIPFLTDLNIGIFEQPLGRPGTLQILAIGLVYASLAMSFDVLFGYTGLLSFGHTLWFALGVYLPTVFMAELGVPYTLAVVMSLGVSAVGTVIVGSVALRTYGIAFAMVTFAFAEAFSIFVERDPTGLFGGDEGLRVESDLLPEAFRGVVGLTNVYWLALLLAVVVFLVLLKAVKSNAGHVWRAIAENPNRVQMMGMEPYPYRMLSFVVSGMAAALCGSVYLLIVKIAFPTIADASFALIILVMVTLGGSGRLWGAALGGFVYGVASIRISSIATSGFGAELPPLISGPLREPQLYIGVAVVILMVLAPNGLAGIIESASSQLAHKGRQIPRARRRT
jgi:branched-chain amino acid transport system permease protein